MDTAVFSVSGMHCASCGIVVDDAVEELAGVAESVTDVRRGRTTVSYDPRTTSLSAISAAVAATGYHAALAS